MSINPTSSSNGPVFSNDPTLARDGILNFTGDTLDLAMKDYLFAIEAGSRRNRKSSEENREADALLEIQLYLAMAERSLQFSEASSNISSQVASWNVVYNAQVAERADINHYNTVSRPNLINARTTLQNAINAYNAIPSPSAADLAALNLAIANYQAIVVPIVNIYNATTSTYNTNIAAVIPGLNSQRAEIGMPPLVGGNAALSTVPLTINTSPRPIPTLPSIPTLPLIGLSLTPISVSQALVLYLPSVLRTVTTVISTSDQQLASSVAYQESLTEVNPYDAGAALAYIQRHPPVLFNTSGGIASGTSASVVSQIAGPGSPFFERIASRARYNSEVYKEEFPLPPEVVDQIRAFSASLLSEAAIQAGENVSKQISETSISSKGVKAFFDAGSAIAFANVIHGIGSSGSIAGGINRIINSSKALSSLSDGEKRDLINSLTAQVNLTLSQTALSQLALSLKIPGLIAQVFGNVEEIQRLGLSNVLSPEDQPPLFDILAKPLSVVALKADLLEKIILARGTPVDSPEYEKTATAVSFAVNAAIVDGDFTDIPTFQTALTDSLIKQGVSPEEATKLSTSAGQFLNTEIALPFLDRPFISSGPIAVLSNELNAAAVKPQPVKGIPEVLKSEAPVGTSQRIALENLYAQAIESLAFGAALDRVLRNGPMGTIRNFRSQLVEQLIASNISPVEAEALADLSVKVLAPKISDDPLLNHKPDRALSRESLLESVTGFVTDSFGQSLGTGAAVFASQTSLAVTKLLTDFNDTIRYLKERAEEKDLEDFRKNARILTNVELPQVSLQLALNQTSKTSVEAALSNTYPADQSDIRKRKQPAPGATPGILPYRGSIDIPI